MRSAWTQALLLLAGTAWAVSAANTPGRQVTIAGMRLNTWAYQEKSATNPLDDICEYPLEARAGRVPQQGVSMLMRHCAPIPSPFHAG